MLWVEKHVEEKKVLSLSQVLTIPTLLSRLLCQRGLSEPEKALRFLQPKLAHLADPFVIPGLKDAVFRIIEAIQANEKVLIVGDYDVDGITSTVIIKKNLSALGLDPSYVIPKRKNEGYGLTGEILQRGLRSGNVSLVIALDCGTNSIKEAQMLSDKGIDLIIVDHHQAKENIPKNRIILNPHLHPDRQEPWRNLCTAGLAFKLIHGLLKELRTRGCPKAHFIDPRDSLSLTALGTIADLVPLLAENRILARFGLKHLGKKTEPGLNALLKESNIKKEIVPESEDVTFKLAPRINACGRLDNPEVASKLLLEKNESICKELAKKMNHFNEQRKEIEMRLTEKALSLANQKFDKCSGVVACGRGEFWNPGVVGIVAGKLANELGKPCLVLAETEDGVYRGSGRGLDGINLMDALEMCKNYLKHWGGHPAAVGLSVEKENIGAFSKAFIQSIDRLTGGIKKKPRLHIDAIISPSEISEEMMKVVKSMAPYGQDNPEPLLAIKKIKLTEPVKKVGSGEHFQFSIFNGLNSISGIAWRMADRMPPTKKEIDLAFKLRWNEWNNKRNLQMILEDWKLSD